MKNIFTLIIISLSAIAGNAHIDPETWDHKGINFYKAKVTDLEYSIYNFIELLWFAPIFLVIGF